MLYAITGNGLTKFDETLTETTVIPLGTEVSIAWGAGIERGTFIVVSEIITEGHYGGQRAIQKDLKSEKKLQARNFTGRTYTDKIGTFYATGRVIDPLACELMVHQYETKKLQDSAARENAQIEHKRLVALGKENMKLMGVEDWQGVILAELEIDESDAMTDYFGSKTAQSVILGFSTHKRKLFNEMRKFAATFEQTKHLTEGEKFEHREDYTGGNGYYLAQRRHSGWQVRKVGTYEGDRIALLAADEATCLPLRQLKKPESCAHTDVETSSEAIGTITINEQFNGIEIRFPNKPAQEILSLFKTEGIGWRWHKKGEYWYNKNTDTNLAFANRVVNSNSTK